ncbi:hypothetical protein ABN112_24010, partial [Escherichia coli]|uniref:F4 family fimbrial subunit n=1 Tax=Escherichia coli TaxID=562 RepID=UPI0032D9D365
KYQGIYFMKKTLIALAVAASAAVSGSAMAATWTPNLAGVNNFELGGTLTPKANVTPWEAMIGDAVKNLDSDIKKGQSKVTMLTKSAIPVLGIRTVSNTAFVADMYQSATPNIDYGTAVDLGATVDSKAPLTLEVKDSTTDLPIGTLRTSLYVAAMQAYTNQTSSKSGMNPLIGEAGGLFEGGLPTQSAAIGDVNQVMPTLDAISPEFGVNFDKRGQSTVGNPGKGTIGGSNILYSAYYGSGIKAGESIVINLTQPIGATAITWKATLPITISYQ